MIALIKARNVLQITACSSWSLSCHVVQAEELGELSIWHCMPTTYFHPVRLLVDDLDWSPPALHIFFSVSPSTDWSTEITQRAAPGSQTEGPSTCLGDTLRRRQTKKKQKTKTYSSLHLIFCSSALFLCYCVLYTVTLILWSSFVRHMMLSTSL